MSPGPSKQFDREDVLERATLLFWTQGYEATGMSQLLEHVGIGRQSLYDTFGDKRSLFLEVLAHYFRTRVGPILAQLKAPGSPLGNIQTVFGMWEKMGDKKPFCGCLVGNATAELGRRDPEIARTLSGYLDTLVDGFADAIERARAAGEIETGLLSRDLARTLVHTVQGVALLTKVFQDKEAAASVLRSSFAMLSGRA